MADRKNNKIQNEEVTDGAERTQKSRSIKSVEKHPPACLPETAGGEEPPSVARNFPNLVVYNV